MSEESNELNIAKYISATILISLASQIAIYNYYLEFNFIPAGYFDLTDYILSASKDFLIVGCLMFLLFQTLGVHIRPFDTRLIATKKEFKNRFFNYLNRNQIITFSTLMYALLIIINIIKGNPYSIYVYALTALWLLELLNLNSKKYLKIKREEPEHFASIKSRTPFLDFNLIFLAIIYVSASQIFAISKARRAKEDNQYVGTMLTLESKEVIKATRKALLIGKNKDYYFFYNLPDSNIRAIKRSDIKKEVIKYRTKSSMQAYLFSY